MENIFNKGEYIDVIGECAPDSNCGHSFIYEPFQYKMNVWVEKWLAYLIFGMVLYIVELVSLLIQKNKIVHSLFPLFYGSELKISTEQNNFNKATTLINILVLFLFVIISIFMISWSQTNKWLIEQIFLVVISTIIFVLYASLNFTYLKTQK
ncbi:hypothetical protein [Mycoplasma hafezii]|uniref:hypothetical protein n=1 Tax=Mycoplasma hafezii TaxID=525886 RepID=UPI003CF673BE